MILAFEDQASLSTGLATGLDWLCQPWSGAEDHVIPAWMAWHGRLMVLAWGILMPVGTLVARYFKIWPGQDWPKQLDDPRWWLAHRWAQSLGMVAACAGLWLVWRYGAASSLLALWHGFLGWTVMALGVVQICGGVLRGSKGGPTDPRNEAGDHYDMTLRRVVFEYAHKFGGYLALILSVAVIFMGLSVADAPRWMWLILMVWWLLLLMAAVVLQRCGMCVDTYQAIWGPSLELPGNRLRPIGLGVNVRPVATMARPPKSGVPRR